jgi:hypothetical protein
MPESPRFLYAAGDTRAGDELLARMAKTNGTAGPAAGCVHAESSAGLERGSFSALCTPAFRRSTLCLTGLFWGVSFPYYCISFLSPALLDEAEHVYASVLLSIAAEVPGRVLPVLLVDRWGRRRSLACMGAVRPFSRSLCLFSITREHYSLIDPAAMLWSFPRLRASTHPTTSGRHGLRSGALAGRRGKRHAARGCSRDGEFTRLCERDDIRSPCLR